MVTAAQNSRSSSVASKPNYDLLINVRAFVFWASSPKRAAFLTNSNSNFSLSLSLLKYTDTRIRRHQLRRLFHRVYNFNVLRARERERGRDLRRTDHIRYVYERSADVDFEIFYQRGKSFCIFTSLDVISQTFLRRRRCSYSDSRSFKKRS